MVLGLLFISIDLSNPTTVKAATYEEIMEEALMSKSERILHKLNPANYFKKRNFARGSKYPKIVNMITNLVKAFSFLSNDIVFNGQISIIRLLLNKTDGLFNQKVSLIDIYNSYFP